MKFSITSLVTSLVATMAFSAVATAQTAPGTGGGGGCDEACVTNVNQEGQPIGKGCVSGEEHNRTNCRATVTNCDTDPCEGFAAMTSSGSFLRNEPCQASLVAAARLATASQILLRAPRRVALAGNHRGIVQRLPEILENLLYDSKSFGIPTDAWFRYNVTSG